MNTLPKISLPLVLFVFILAGSISAQVNWKLEHIKDGITVYSGSDAQSRFKSFKANTVMPGSVNAFVAVLQDIPALPGWIRDIKNTRLLKQSGDSLQIYYGETQLPFPFDNRDGIYSNAYKWKPANKELYVEVRLLPAYLDPVKNKVRVSGKGYWIVRELKGGNIDITFSMQVDPGGEVPAWLVNIFVEDTPVSTLQGLRRVIGMEKYQGKKYGFIRR